MKTLVYGMIASLVMCLAFWAYQQNYATQAVLAETDEVRRDISRLRQRLTVLRAEWAYLNRPDRLRDLANLNFDRLQLFALAPEQFGEVMEVSFPKADDDDLFGIIEVRGVKVEVGR